MSNQPKQSEATETIQAAPTKQTNMMQPQGLMKVPRTKNYAPAEIQVTSEQLIRESIYYQLDEHVPAKIRITDPDELEDYKYRMRKDFEDSLRRQKHHLGTWIKYAEWEASIHEFQRSRSVFERALAVDFQHVTLWLKYADMEMRNKFVNHARNVWERACKHLPRVDQFWYKYALMEEMLGNTEKVRQVFEDWMTWQPTENAWNAYLKFEERLGQINNCRSILERYIELNPNTQSYIKAAKFEEHHRNRDRARLVYERSLAELGKMAFVENLFIQFTRFEIRHKQHSRAKILFEYALENMPKDNSKRLYEQFIQFQKQYGSGEDMEQALIAKRRDILEQELAKESFNYDLWFEITRLEEQVPDNIQRARSVYEQAVSNVPPASTKPYWKRYIYLWINYAIFEEIHANDMLKANQVFEKVISIVPHNQFTFSKLWILYAQFLVRDKQLERARKTFGRAIGTCPKPKIFTAYAELEMQLGEVDRCRKIYQKQIELLPQICQTWVQFADFEAQLDEIERARSIYEMAIKCEVQLDMPESLWKSYIDLEIDQDNLQEARALYSRLIEKTKHIKVWISSAQFESRQAQDSKHARQVYEDAYKHFKEDDKELKEERVMLLENWIKFEEGPLGDQKMAQSVRSKMPKRVKKRRKATIVNTQTGEQVNEDAKWEEFYDYIFPDDAETGGKNLKLLDMAKKWKQAKVIVDK